MMHPLIDDLISIRNKNPLIHNVTNLVTMDFIANGLLAMGASPVMSHGSKDIVGIIESSSAIVINIGTLDDYWVSCFKEVLLKARELKKPVVLDPVGAGATSYRTKACHDLLDLGGVSILKGNASEIMAIAGEEAKTKGVDAQANSDEAIVAAKYIAKTYGACVVISGKKDLVVTSRKIGESSFGHPMMAKVTGMGCFLTAAVAAFHGVNKDPFSSALHAVKFIGIIGEAAAALSSVKGPASFKVAFIDGLYGMSLKQIIKRLK